MSEREINKVVSSSMKETAIRNVGNTDLIDDNVRMENEMHEGLGIEDDMNIAALAPSTGARDNIPDATGGDTSQAQERKSISRIIVTTDPPLLAIDKSKQPIGPTLMINYQIPQRKVGHIIFCPSLAFSPNCAWYTKSQQANNDGTSVVIFNHLFLVGNLC